MKKEYQVVVYMESALGSLFLGSSKVNPQKFSDFLNVHAGYGWEVVTMDRESRRMALFFNREAFVVVMCRQANAAPVPPPATGFAPNSV